MTAERDSMTSMRFPFQPWGSTERSDEAPRAGTPDRLRTRRLWPSRSGASSPQVSAGFWRRRILPQPGEVGRLLRREGYSSNLTAWRKARRKGSLRELIREEARRETGRTQPAGCEGARARGASGSPGARVAHRAHDPRRAGKSCRAAGIEPRTRNALLMAVQPLAAQVGVAPACQALGVSRATFYRRQRSTPGHQQPRPTPARALCEAEREQILDVLATRASSNVRRRRSSATLLDEGHYLCSERTMSDPGRRSAGPRAGISASIPEYIKPELVRHGAEPDLVLGHHHLLAPMAVLLPLRRLDIFSRYASAGWSQTGRTRRWPVVRHRRDLPQTGRPAPGAHPAWTASDRARR